MLVFVGITHVVYYSLARVILPYLSENERQNCEAPVIVLQKTI